MRTCKYTIRIDYQTWHARKDREHKAQWSRFVATCKSLAAGGFEYAVTVAYVANQIVLTIIGTAGRAVAERKPVRRAFTMPAKVSVEKCQKQAAIARKGALDGGIVTTHHRMSMWQYNRGNRALDRTIGHAVAKAKARGESFIMDGNIRQSVGALITARKQSEPYYSGAEVDPIDVRAARLLALSEYKYWRELEALSGQREKLRPGVADTLCADDEVAEVAA